MIRCLVFDFDGTLVPSNRIKRDAFAACVAHIPGAPAQVEAIIAAHPDADRHGVFARLGAALPGCGNPQALAARYTAICHADILNLLDTGPTRALFASLRDRGIGRHIASATPYKALRHLLDAAALTPLLDSIHGTPQDKKAALGEILQSGVYMPHEVAVIGDGDNDRDAANAHGCRFVRVDNEASQLYGNGAAAALSFLAAQTTPTACQARP